MNTNLILRTVQSPFGDITKGTVLSQEDVDNNFIYLKGNQIFTAETNGGIITLKKLNGESLLFTAGTTNVDYWISGTSGTNSLQVNNGSTEATAAYAIAIQRDTKAYAELSFVGGTGNQAYGQLSFAMGSSNKASGNTSFIFSTNSIVSGHRSAVIGGQNITGSTNDTVYVPNLNINTTPSIGSGTKYLMRNESTGAIEQGEILVGNTPFTALTNTNPLVWYVNTTPKINVTLTANTTLEISGVTNGSEGVIIIKQGTATGNTMTLPTGSLVANGGAGYVTLTTGLNAIDILTFTYDGSKYYFNQSFNFS